MLQPCNRPSSMKKNNNIVCVLLLALLMLSSAALRAQEDIKTDNINPYRVSVRSTLYGVSLLNNLDTYLSGYNYTGAAVYLNHETMRKAHTGSYDWKFQTVTDGLLGLTSLHSTSQLTMLLSRSWSGYHTFRVGERLQLLAGAQIQVAGGVLYIPSNGNNLVSVKLRTALAASTMAIYRFSVAERECIARWQTDVPLAGIMFSPQFGQSYYEIFGLGDTDGIVKFSNPVNSPSWRHSLSLDVPVGRNTLRVAYIADLYQSRVNSLRTHLYSHSFALGFSRTIYKVKNNDPIKACSPY